jgi:hypothetical protein
MNAALRNWPGFVLALFFFTWVTRPAQATTFCPGNGTNSAVVAEYLFFDGSGSTTLNTGLDGDDGNLTLTNGANFNADVPPSNDGCPWSINLPATGSGSSTPALESDPAYDPLAGAEAFTIMGWVRRQSGSTSSNQSARIVSDASSTGTNALGVEFRFSGSAGTLALRVNGNEVSTTVGGIPPNSNTWRHVAVVYDGTRPATNALTRNVHFYVDGIQRGDGNTLQGVVVGSNTSRLTVGNSSVSRGAANLLVGKVDDVFILYEFAPGAVGNGKTSEVIRCYMNFNDDIEPPTITCPANITVSTDVGQCAASGVNLGQAGASDNCAVASVVNNAPSVFPLGVTLVTWTATDFGGNATSCTQLVAVVDTIPPSITCPPDVVTGAAPCLAAATNINLGEPVTSDNCGVAGITSIAPAQYPLGTTSIQWKVWDASGNTNSCVQQVTVIPSPIADCDGDGLSDWDEIYVYNTDPFNPDTDGDGLFDGWKVQHGLNPLTHRLTNDLLAWWTFDDAGGAVASNRINPLFNGVLENADVSSWTTGFYGGGVRFNGTNQYIRVDQTQALISGGPFSVCAVVYVEGDYESRVPSLVSDSSQIVHDFPVAVTGTPTGWIGGSISGGGDGNAAWTVPGQGRHAFRAVFGGSGSADSTIKSRNSFMARAVNLPEPSPERPQEWAFNISYDSSNASGASDFNRIRVWLWANGSNLNAASGYALEYGESGSTDRLHLFRMINGSKDSLPILSSVSELDAGDAQFSVRVRRHRNGLWQLWHLSNTATNNVFPTNNPMVVAANERSEFNSVINVSGKGYVGFQVFLRTSASSSRRLALDDFSILDERAGYSMDHADSLWAQAGDRISSSIASVVDMNNSFFHVFKDRWQSVVMTYNGTNTRLYLSGQLKSEVPGRFDGALQPELWLGRGHGDQDDSWFKGILDDLRIYGRALTTQEAADLYNAVHDADNDGLANRGEFFHQTDPWNDDTSGDGIPDGWAVLYGLDPLDPGVGGMDLSGDGIPNYQKYLRGLDPFVWNGVQDLTVYPNPIVATNAQTDLHVRFLAFQPQRVTITFSDFSYEFDPYTGEFGSHNIAVLGQVVTNVAPGTNIVVWTGRATNGHLHGAQILTYEIRSEQTEGVATNQDLYAPVYVAGVSELYADYQTLAANPVRNRAGIFRVGSQGMAPLLVTSPLYGPLIRNRVVDRRLTISDWIPFKTGGQPARSWDPFPVLSIRNRVLPVNSVIYLQQHAAISNYSVEAYRTTPAYASVIHAVFALDRPALLTLELRDPDGNFYPVHVRQQDGTYVSAQNVALAGGYHQVEFMAMDYSGSPVKLFADRVAGDRLYSVRFAVEDMRTGNITEKWAGLTIEH